MQQSRLIRFVLSVKGYKNMIKLVVTDVDGTLVKEGTLTLNPEYFDVIRALKAKGIRVVVASGRQYESIRRLMEPVEDMIWYIADGGATLKLDKGFEAAGEFPREWVKQSWKDISNIPGMDCALCAADKCYAPFEHSEMFRRLRDDYQFDVECLHGWDHLPDVPITKISLYRPTEIEKYADKYFIPKWEDKFHMSIAGEWWLDCLMNGVNKGTALERIMERMGICAEEVLATGDNPNDLEMIKTAGTGLAVATAHPRVKKAADGIIPSYTEDGVLREWKKLL